jgi:uncharacterized protein (TIGR03435 family)
MRLLSLLLVLAALPFLMRPAVAQTALRVGDALPNVVLPRVVNNTAANSFALATAQGKVLVLEFWSTSCSPCIPALEKLAALQQAHPTDLQVVGISTDSEARLLKFLTKRPLPVLLASAPDPKQDINRLFPHRIVPHTVVVDRNRRVVAITSPEQFDEQALLAVAAGRPVRLTPKQDLMSDNPMSFFAVDSTTRYGVNVRPFIQGLPGMMRPERKGPFARRRLTAINLDPNSLYQLAYEISHRRILNELPDSLRQYDDLSRVCLDLIVPPGQEQKLHPLLQEVLKNYLAVQAVWVPATKPVYVLRRRKGQPALLASTRPEQYSFGGGAFAMQGERLERVRGYLENELDRPVVDETGLTDRYDVAFAVQQENLKSSLSKALDKLGLEVVEATREIKLLRLRVAAQ